MKQLKDHIYEELEDNLFYLLEKWFKNNIAEKQEFAKLVDHANDIKFDLKKEIKGTALSKNLKEFISFIYDDNNQDLSDIEYDQCIYKLSQILKICHSNKSEDNPFA